MKLHVDLPENLAVQARELADREHITVEALIASYLAATIDRAPHRPTIAERAARADWEKVDAILARVPRSSRNRATSDNKVQDAQRKKVTNE